MEWPFPDHPELGVFVTRSVLDGVERPLVVDHDDEGDWIFAGSVEADDVPEEDLLLVHLHHVIEQYPECLELADLPEGMRAARANESAPWHRMAGDPTPP